MNIPNFELGPMVDKDGYPTPVWKYILEQLISQLQLNAGQFGLVPAQQTATTLSIIQEKSQIGTIIVDSTNQLPKIRLLDGTFHTIGTL